MYNLGSIDQGAKHNAQENQQSVRLHNSLDSPRVIVHQYESLRIAYLLKFQNSTNGSDSITKIHDDEMWNIIYKNYVQLRFGQGAELCARQNRSQKACQGQGVFGVVFVRLTRRHGPRAGARRGCGEARRAARAASAAARSP